VADKSRWGMSRWEAVLVVVIIGVLVALLYPAVIAARRAARRSMRMNNLKQIALALQNFDDVYKHLPAAVHRDEMGRPFCSWRWQLIHYLEAIMLAVDFADRWDDPTNRWLTCHPHHCYCLRPDDGQPDCAHTNVVAVAGPGTAFEEGRECRLENIDPDTILVVEVASSETYWAEPGDLDVRDVPQSITDGPEGDGFFVAFADGAVWFLRPQVPLEDLKKLFTIEGAKQHDRDQVLGPYASMR
jgi:hypothetical protein